MSLQPLTVRRKHEYGRSGKNYASETQTYATERIISAVPSICKKEGVSDGLVNSEVLIDDGHGNTKLWCTETAAEIEALDDA
jgi:hypothetical protein